MSTSKRVQPMSDTLHNLRVLTQREYLDTVKTKFFWISTLLVPIIFVAVAILIGFLSSSSDLQKYVVIDESNRFAEQVRVANLRSEITTFVSNSRRIDPITAGIPADLLDAVRETNETDGRTSFIELVLAQLLDDPTPESGSLELREQARQLADWWKANESRLGSLELGLLREKFLELSLPDLSQRELNEKLNRGEIQGYFMIPENVLESNEGLRFIAIGTGTSTDQLESHYQSRLEFEVKKARVDSLAITQENYNWIQKPVRFNFQRTTETGGTQEVSESDRIEQYIPMAFVYVMWFVVFLGSASLINSTVEEKNSKVVEVLLSSMNAAQLMYGKVIGSGASILTMLGVWIGMILVTFLIIPIALDLPVSVWAVFDVVKPIYFAKFTLYALLGFAMFAPLMSAIGATASSLKAAQALITPFTMVMVVPLMLMFFITDDTDSMLAQTFTFIPIYTPFSLMMRAATPPHFMIELLAVAIAVVTAYALNLMSIRLFERAILREGPTPTYGQLLQLLRN